MSKKLKEGGVFYPDHIYTLPSPGGEKALIWKANDRGELANDLMLFAIRDAHKVGAAKGCIQCLIHLAGPLVIRDPWNVFVSLRWSSSVPNTGDCAVTFSPNVLSVLMPSSVSLKLLGLLALHWQ
jgi:hypothetical protein